MKKKSSKKKYNFTKFFKIIFLFLGLIILTIFFFYSPKEKYELYYKIYKTPASKIFINILSDTIIPYKAAYRCGDRIVDRDGHIKCWSEYWRKPVVLYPKWSAADIPLANLSAPEPKVFDDNYDKRDKFQKALSIILFGISLFFLWRLRDNIVNSILTFYKKI